MKKKIAAVVGIMLAAVVVVGTIPFPQEIMIRETAIEYSLSDENIAVPHDVVIEGTYYTRLFGKDRFAGTFYISGIKNLESGMQADFEFHPHLRYDLPQFAFPLKLPGLTEIGVIFFDRNFETLALQLAVVYREEENGVAMSHGDEESNFIVVGASDREEAIAIYQELLMSKK